MSCRTRYQMVATLRACAVVLLTTALLAGAAACSSSDSKDAGTSATQEWIELDESGSGTIYGATVTTVEARLYAPFSMMSSWAEASLTTSGSVTHTTEQARSHLAVIKTDTVSGIEYSRVVGMLFDDTTEFDAPGATKPDSLTEVFAAPGILYAARIDFHKDDYDLVIDYIEIANVH